MRTVARLVDRPAAALTDLAAALLVRAERRDDSRDLFEAAEAAALALEADSLYPPARFNMALALHRMGLVDESARASDAYVALGGRDGWAAEAGARRAWAGRLPAPSFDPAAADLPRAVAAAPQAARLHGWDRALSAWGAAVGRDDGPRAGRELAVARVVGRALEARRGDATLADAVRAIDAVDGNREQTRALAAAHRAFAEGQVHYTATRYADAERAFARAATVPGPLAQWAEAFRGATEVYGGRPARGERRLRGVLARVDTVRYRALAARAGWMLGTTLLRGGRAEAALAQLRPAADRFASIGELEHEGAVRTVAAHATYLLGDSRATADAVHSALRALRAQRASGWLHNALYMGALALERERLVHAAMRLHAEGLFVAARTGNPAFVAEAYLARARLAATRPAEERAGVGRDIAAARRALDMAALGGARDWIRADLRAIEAALLPPSEHGRAIAALDSVIAYYEHPAVPSRLLPALVARADVRLRSGDPARAGADLDRVMLLFARERGVTDSLPLRASLVDAARAVVERAVMLEVARGDPAAALARLEAGRAALRPSGPAASGRAPRLRAPRGEAVVAYAVVGDSLLAWAVTDTLVRLVRSVVPRAELQRAVERARSALELRTADAARGDLAQLYDWLVRPIRGVLPSTDLPLAIVADGELAAVPFPALLERDHGRYLVEEHPLRFLGSVQDVMVARPNAAAGRSPLLIADPAFDGTAHPGLRPLAGAREEVAEIATQYPGARVLAGTGATAPAVLRAMPRASFVHYAGHALFDDERPLRSVLLLASSPVSGDAGDTGSLTAERIASLDLTGVRLVVLSACETLRVTAGRAGGLAGLAGAFAAAGAGGVVGAQWRVDDSATREFMTSFYRAYARAADAAAAVRAAQLELLRSPDPALRSPSAWAGFRYLGR